MTLPELVMAVLITSILALVLGGVTSAVWAARQHVEGVEDATVQAEAALERIRYMISHTGVYKSGSQPVTDGLAVVNRSAGLESLPEVLVVWSGGRSGGMAAQGLKTQLPKVNELVFYLPQPSNPRVLVEMMIPGNATTIDFRSASFESTVLTLISGGGTETVPICDRLRVASVSGSPRGALWFAVLRSPDAAALSATPGTSEWNALTWPQGIVNSSSGCRQATVQMELQVETRAYTAPGSGTSPTAIPFFGSASIRYEYKP